MLAAIDLVFFFSHHARNHEFLYRRYNELVARIRTEDHAEESYRKWCKEDHEIGADEPPTYWALEADCYNEVVRARGLGKEYLRKLRLWHRCCMHYFRFENTDFPQPVDSVR